MSQTATQTDQANSLLLNADAAAGMLAISRTLFYEMHSDGRLGPMAIRFGRCSRWRRDEMVKWVEADCPPRRQWQDQKKWLKSGAKQAEK